MIWSFLLSTIFAFTISAFIPSVFDNYYLDLPFWLLSFLIPFLCSFFFLTRHIIRYVLTLAAGLDVIAQGKLHYRVPVTRRDELGNVAVNINAMAEKLEAQINRERMLEKAKLELITGVSHDLRTPLTSIIGYLDLLKDKAYRDEEEHDRFVSNTYNKSLQLKSLIGDLFEYTRLTIHEVKLEKETINLRELLVQLLVEMEPIAKENQLMLETSISNGRIMAEVDPEMIRRSIDNLLMNALKFSVRPGLIRVMLCQYEGMARITVENEGAPITKEQEERLLERFYKADDARSQQNIQTGSGLGLSIAKSIAELHGGALEHEHLNGHFRFHIILPLFD
ncbi:ATP-binding protein [Paenibacillus puldeungensis]|uniref:histidine kinase n=2 Tax=Paenibacillus puldeungensis TaxID=696536 RepID=A0ABW3RRP2_9BACL